MADAKTISRQPATTHPSPPITEDMTADEYVRGVLKLHAAEHPRGIVNGPLLSGARHIGDMMLAVVPKNRFFCALGLTTGGFLGLKAASLLAGRNLNSMEETAKPASKLLKPLHGLLAFEPERGLMKDRWAKIGALYTFTAVSMVGIVAGATFAYKSAHKKNETPASLEDYAARAAQHQGEKWKWLAAVSGIFGSTAGYFAVPFVPGVNYGSSIAFYTTLNQDRKIMTPGLHKATGTETFSYLGLREGMDYLCKYAVHNPAQNPTEIEFLALTTLAPLAHAAGTQLKASTIKAFADKVHEVRDQYWQEGGIPADRKKEAMQDMEAHFKGKGLDKTLLECGFDTMNIDFTKLNGLIGKVGNKLGATKHIVEDQAAYRAMAAQWRSEWQTPETPASSPAPDTSTRVAANTVEPKSFVNDNLKKSGTIVPRALSHQEAALSASSGAMMGI